MKSFFEKFDIKLKNQNLKIIYKFKYRLFSDRRLISYYKPQFHFYHKYLIKYNYFINDFLKRNHPHRDWHIINLMIDLGYAKHYLKHPSNTIRRILVDKGFYLDILINDSDIEIRNIAIEKLKEIDKFNSYIDSILKDIFQNKI